MDQNDIQTLILFIDHLTIDNTSHDGNGSYTIIGNVDLTLWNRVLKIRASYSYPSEDVA